MENVSRNLLIGLALQAAALVAAWASVRLLYFMSWAGVLLISTPLMIASVFYLMRSGLPLPLRILLSFWIGLFPLYSAAQSMIEWRSVRPEVYLIPKSFRGHVEVRFGIAGGAPLEAAGKALVFRVGADGQLSSQVKESRLRFHDDARYARREFYLVEENGGRSRIEQPVPYDLDQVPKDKVILSIAGESFHGDQVSLFEFYVGTPDEVRRFWSER